MNVLFYALGVVVAGVGLASAWISGRDVGYRNATREHDLLDDNEPTIYRPDNDAGRRK